MLELRSIESGDVAIIHSWPRYPSEYDDLDYALRINGWLDEYLQKPETWIYVAKQNEEIVAFTILSKSDVASAEFRIALRPDKFGQGLGKAIASMTLRKGFNEMSLACIHLIVRKNNVRAIHLYRQLGFVEQGEVLKVANNKRVEFLAMNIFKATCPEIQQSSSRTVKSARTSALG